LFLGGIFLLYIYMTYFSDFEICYDNERNERNGKYNEPNGKFNECSGELCKIRLVEIKSMNYINVGI